MRFDGGAPAGRSGLFAPFPPRVFTIATAISSFGDPACVCCRRRLFRLATPRPSVRPSVKARVYRESDVVGWGRSACDVTPLVVFFVPTRSSRPQRIFRFSGLVKRERGRRVEEPQRLVFSVTFPVTSLLCRCANCVCCVSRKTRYRAKRSE